MLKLIEPKESDTLYILGDLVDRGDSGIKIIFDLIEKKYCHTAWKSRP